MKVVDAIELDARARRGEPLPELDRTGRVGTRAPRYEGDELALGDKPFVGDLVAPEMLYGALRFSDHPRARILRIDTSRAEAHPGVVSVLTAADVPGERTQGALTKDWRQLVAEGETTAYVGDVLAAVAAESRHAAREAAELVDVEYEVLDPVTDPFEAMDPAAPRLHESGNVLSVSRVQRGDVDAALAGAAHVVEETYRTQCIEHAFLEPESALCRSGGRRRVPGLLARPGSLGGPAAGRVVPRPARGAGAGDAGLGGRRVRRERGPERAGARGSARTDDQAARAPHAHPRESLRFHSKRHPMWLTYTLGCDAEGRLVALRARIVGDTGAYASVGDKVLERAAGHACSAYAVPNVDVEATAVYTNNPPSGAMRGFGVNQSNFAVEGVLDALAERVGIDGWEIRWRNALEVGGTLRHRAGARARGRPQEDAAGGA